MNAHTDARRRRRQDIGRVLVLNNSRTSAVEASRAGPNMRNSILATGVMPYAPRLKGLVFPHCSSECTGVVVHSRRMLLHD